MVETLVALGIMSIVTLGIATMISFQSSEVRALNEKLIVKEIESQAKAMFQNMSYCNCVLRDKKFDTANNVIVASDQLTRLKNGYATDPAGSPPCAELPVDFVPPAGSSVGGSLMRIGAVALTDMSLLTPPGTYKANISVSFVDSLRPIRGVKTGIVFSVDTTAGTATARPFAGCGSTGPTGAGGCRFCRDTCGGNWPVYGGMADTKDADYSGSVVLDPGCTGTLQYHSAYFNWKAALCCAN